MTCLHRHRSFLDCPLRNVAKSESISSRSVAARPLGHNVGIHYGRSLPRASWVIDAGGETVGMERAAATTTRTGIPQKANAATSMQCAPLTVDCGAAFGGLLP